MKLMRRLISDFRHWLAGRLLAASQVVMETDDPEPWPEELHDDQDCKAPGLRRIADLAEMIEFVGAFMIQSDLSDLEEIAAKIADRTVAPGSTLLRPSNADVAYQELPMKPCAIWIDDCQGKKDYDGRLLSISTRYWPGPAGGGSMTFDSTTGEIGATSYGKRPSACTAIHLNHGEPDEDGYGEYKIWRKADFVADTEAEVKALVEAWVAQQMGDVIALLGGEAAFTAPWP